MDVLSVAGQISVLPILMFLASCGVSNTPEVTVNDTDSPVCEQCPEMAVIPAGAYLMGADETGEVNDEFDGPQRTVSVSSFEMAVYEVTVGEFTTFADATGHEGVDCNLYLADAQWFLDESASWSAPTFEQGPDHPVVCVSWDETQQYIAWLNEQTGNTYRLPTEAEWEYVAQLTMGREKPDHAQIHEAANVGQSECCGGEAAGADVWERTAPVGSFPADTLGLRDIRGNVWEFQQDCYSPNYIDAPTDGSARLANCADETRRIVRGGSWGDGGELLDTDYRLRALSDQRYFTLGFRLARSIAVEEAL